MNQLICAVCHDNQHLPIKDWMAQVRSQLADLAERGVSQEDRRKLKRSLETKARQWLKEPDPDWRYELMPLVFSQGSQQLDPLESIEIVHEVKIKTEVSKYDVSYGEANIHLQVTVTNTTGALDISPVGSTVFGTETHDTADASRRTNLTQLLNDSSGDALINQAHATMDYQFDKLSISLQTHKQITIEEDMRDRCHHELDQKLRTDFEPQMLAGASFAFTPPQAYSHDRDRNQIRMFLPYVVTDSAGHRTEKKWTITLDLSESSAINSTREQVSEYND